MKKIINYRFLPLILGITFTVMSSAQEASADVKPTKETITYISPDEFSPAIPSTEIKKSVLKDFKRTYGNIQSARWFKTSNGYGVSFQQAGISTRVFYTGNGAVDARIKYYFEDGLPSHVRSVVGANFYDYSISHVAEVQKGDVTAYVIKIQNSKYVKSVKVIDGEWELIESLVKN